MLALSRNYLSWFAFSSRFIQCIQKRDAWLARKDAPKYLKAFSLTKDLPKGKFYIENPFVCVGKQKLSQEQQQLLQEAARVFIPWRKGPWKFFHLKVDAEWRSDFKWNRLANPELFFQKNVLDIGCNNGYFLFRVLEYQPRFVLGIDPMHRLKFAFEWIYSLIEQEKIEQEKNQKLPIAMEMLGVEDLDLLPPIFDTVLLLGILYHRSDPLQTLKATKQVMKPGAHLVVECLTIPGEQPVALFAKERYLNMRNTFFIPTTLCLEFWLHRAGFKNITLLYDAPLTTQEQRQTPWAPVASLQEWTNPQNSCQTIEGYPSQKRTIFVAQKGI